MISSDLAGGLGLVLLPFALLQWRYAEGLTRFNERVDAIGSKRSWSSVEPANWNVVLTRYVGIVGTVLCLLGIAYGFLG